MLRSRRWAIIARYELENGAKLVIDIVALCQSLTLFKGNPGAFEMSDIPILNFNTDEWTLIFAIATLNLLMHLLLNLALKDSCTGGLVETSGLEDMRSIDPIIVAAAHN